jgi:hypothetical protein
MKRLKFKNPFYGMDNALKLIPESYKVDGKEFEITDGIETYRIKWSTSLNEGTVLMSSNKNLINEDMQKIKHLMGYKSEDTLGIVKGGARIDENKKFNVVLDKTKKLLNEMTGGFGFTGEGNLEGMTKMEEEMVDSPTMSKGAIGKEFKEKGASINQADFTTKERVVVSKLMDIVDKIAQESDSYSPQVMVKLDQLTSAINDAISKGGATQGDENQDSFANEGEIYELENPELADLNKDGEISSYEEKRGEAIEKSMKKDRFDEIFDGMYEEDSEEFIPHGHYTVSNTGGYEVMISDSGDAAKVRDAYGSDNPETSDWLEIEYVPGEDGEMEPVIDPNGYNIPLNMVMRTNR